MIRHGYIENVVYDTYNKMDYLRFPLNLKSVVGIIPNCRHTSYQRVAAMSRKTVQEVIDACESASGCTYYDRAKKRYLIMTNEAVFDNNSGRRRWTLAHEIGHILCGHFELCPHIEKFSENDISCYPEYEKEADYFASTLLAPMPYFELFNIRVADDVQTRFMISAEAARYRINEYAKYKASDEHEQWEYQMRELFYEKIVP